MNGRRQLTVWILPALFLGANNLLGQEKQKSEPGDGEQGDREVTSVDYEKWSVQTERQAIVRVADGLGKKELAASECVADLVTLEVDNTPFLSHELVGRPLWQVEVRLDLGLNSAPTAEMSPRVFDVLVDPVDGRLLKIISRWPAGVPMTAPMPSAPFAEQCLRRSGQERYLEFPLAPPRVSFLDALDIVYKKGVGNPLTAKQIMGQYVLRSKMGRGPKAVWAITLWGIPSLPLSRPNVPVDARNHVRNIVDATTGEWISAGTSPQPEPQLPRPAKIRGPVPAP